MKKNHLALLIRWCLIPAIVSAAVFTERPALAQEVGTIQATATVVSGLSVSGTNDLIFGLVSPGVTKIVDKADIGLAGAWAVTGNPGSELQLTFTLPDSLRHLTATAAIPIQFSATDVAYEDGTGGGQTAPAGVLDPNLGGLLRIGGAGSLLLWIGGSITTSLTQTGGDYAADIVLEVIYTGG